MFAALGFEGYRKVLRGAQEVATYLASSIADIGPYRLLTDGTDLPVFAFALAPEVSNYTVFDVSDRLRQNGWLVPAYTFPENRQDLSVLRIVIRAGMTHEMADRLLDDLRKQTEFLESLKAPLPDGRQHQAFAHN
jgi:glutamate decarboxylase